MAKANGFNYAALEGDMRQTAKDGAKTIHAILDRTSEGAIEIGRRLQEVHDVIGAKAFGVWLRAEFKWSQGAASNYMRIAQKFGDLDCRINFQPSALYALARENVEKRALAEAVKLARNGEVITHKRAMLIIRKYQATEGQRPEGNATLAAAMRAVAVAAAPDASADVLEEPPSPMPRERQGESAAVASLAVPIFSRVRTAVRELFEHVGEIVPTLQPDEASALADELLSLAVELRSAARRPAAAAVAPAPGGAGNSASPSAPSGASPDGAGRRGRRAAPVKV